MSLSSICPSVYISPDFIPLSCIHMKSLGWIPVISHLEIDVARKFAIETAHSIATTEFDVLRRMSVPIPTELDG